MSELYIRSQDKEKLMLFEAAHIEKFDREHSIRIDGWAIGEYESKERCLEIMDEIQERICQLHAGSHHDPVYEMPEK